MRLGRLAIPSAVAVLSPRTIRAVREITVVFLGAFGAFAAEGLREGIAERRMVHRMQESVAEEMRQHLSTGGVVLAGLEQAKEEWKSRREAGERPPPWYALYRPVILPTSAWDAMVASGGVGLLDRTLFYRISIYYESIATLLRPLATLDPFVEREILPHLDDPGYFYVEGSDELRPQFREYLARQDSTLARAYNVLEAGRLVRSDLWQALWGHRPS